MAKIPLIECPACDASVSSQAVACPRCGQPLTEVHTPLEKVLRDSEPLSPPPRPPTTQTMQQAMTCPQCGSDSSVTFEMANASGTSSGKLSGLTYSHGGGLGGFGGKTSQQTQIAARTAPPRQPTSSATAFAIVGGIISFSMLVSFISDPSLSLAVGCVAAIGTVVALFKWLNKNAEKDRERYEQQIRAWRRSAICMRCGHLWVRWLSVDRSREDLMPGFLVLAPCLAGKRLAFKISTHIISFLSLSSTVMLGLNSMLLLSGSSEMIKCKNIFPLEVSKTSFIHE